MPARPQWKLLHRILHNVDWSMLLFITVFLNVKLIGKLIAIVLLYVFNPYFKFGFRLKESRLPLFYPLMIAISFLNIIIHWQVKQPLYLLTASEGIAFWVICILVANQLKHWVDRTSNTTLINTITVYFIINFLTSCFQLLLIIKETGAINPYVYQGLYQKYFINTGDYIKGATFDTSTTNAAINAFGLVFFLFKEKYKMVFLCMFTLLLTSSNITDVMVTGILVFLFFFWANRNQKSILVACFMMMIVFLGKVSPQNNEYLSGTFNLWVLHKVRTQTGFTKPRIVRDLSDSVLSPEERKEKIAMLYMDSLYKCWRAEDLKRSGGQIAGWDNNHLKPQIPRDNIHSPPFQHKDDTTAAKAELWKFISANKSALPAIPTDNLVPGKIMAFKQTANYLRAHPLAIVTGAGTGNFSSKLAFRATALHFAGGYPKQLAYINTAFLQNHLAVYLHFFGAPDKMHSITNTPNAVYDQIASEYGAVGILTFVFGYLGYFIDKRKKLGYGLPLLLLLCGYFAMDYWFEQLSIVILFELMLFLNIKENKLPAHE